VKNRLQRPTSWFEEVGRIIWKRDEVKIVAEGNETLVTHSNLVYHGVGVLEESPVVG